MVSLIHLQVLWNFKQKQLEKEIENFVYTWNKEHKCGCVKNWKGGDDLIECSHLTKEKLKKFGDKNKKQFKDILFFRTLALKTLRQ